MVREAENKNEKIFLEIFRRKEEYVTNGRIKLHDKERLSTHSSSNIMAVRSRNMTLRTSRKLGRNDTCNTDLFAGYEWKKTS
jgi:hypothetical protein